MKSYRVYEVSAGVINEGAIVGKLGLRKAGKSTPPIEIGVPAVVVGDRGRGGYYPFVAVVGTEPGERIRFAQLGRTKTGGWKLIACEEPTTKEAAVVVSRAPERAVWGNEYTGDRIDVESYYQDVSYKGFPGQVFACGVRRAGFTGENGRAEDLVALVTAGEVFRAAHSNHPYGRRPDLELFYVFDGDRLLVFDEASRKKAEMLLLHNQ